MEIHRPKPVHGLREFAKEIGIIVIGVLIALAGEQAVAALHWAHRVADAEASMRKELGDDDGAQAEARRLVSECIDAQLDTIERALLAERDGGPPVKLAVVHSPDFKTWDSDAWRAAVSSGATSHMSTQRMYDWSSPYALIADMDATSVREFNDRAPLARVTTLRPHPTDAERERLLDAVAAAERDNQLLTSLSGTFLRYAGMTGSRTSVARRNSEVAAQLKFLPGCRVGHSAGYAQTAEPPTDPAR